MMNKLNCMQIKAPFLQETIYSFQKEGRLLYLNSTTVTPASPSPKVPKR